MPQRARTKSRLTDADYTRLLDVRTALRRFESWSADRAAEHGLTSSQHQLLLAVRGHPGNAGPTIGRIADYLLVRHHSAVELVDRSERAGLVERRRDDADHRVIRLRLSARGARILRELTDAHVGELARLAALLESATSTLAG
jgi:DNA-binding MarR family transcriptional regulator